MRQASARRHDHDREDPMTTHQSDHVLSWRGRELYDRDGDKIGKVEDSYLDSDNKQPEWALV
jgi:hypothetical protein